MIIENDRHYAQKKRSMNFIACVDGYAQGIFTRTAALKHSQANIAAMIRSAQNGVRSQNHLQDLAR
jgi:hypothetical protein